MSGTGTAAPFKHAGAPVSDLPDRPIVFATSFPIGGFADLPGAAGRGADAAVAGGNRMAGM